jgi:uncharacterized protein (DUF2062 family)
VANQVKRWLKRVTPDRHQISGRRHLKVFGNRLQDPNLWHLNRRSVSGAVAIGLFVMYLPPLGQMVIAAAAAIVLRVNLPISASLVWVTNPVTIPPMYYLAYLVGSWILGIPATAAFSADFWFDWRNWLEIIAPLTVGGLICGALCSVAGYAATQALWRWNLVRQIRRRRMRLLKTRQATEPAAGNGGDAGR